MKVKMSFMSGPHNLAIKEVELPPLKDNQVLVKLKACGICGSDVHCYEGDSAEGRYDIAPYTPGHEWGGVVVETGKRAAQRFKVGDKLTGDCVMADWICHNCKEGKMPSACDNMREAGFRPDSPGGMGEYLIIEEDYIHKVPDNWSYEEAAWVETFSIGYFGIWGNGGYIDASDTAIILGAGPIGLTASMVAATSGARVIVIEPDAFRQNFVKDYGADIILDPTKADIVQQVMDVTEGRGGDVCVECSGNNTAIASLFDVAAHGARVRLIGHSIGRKVPVEIGKTIWKTLNITGSGGTKNFGQRTIRFMNRVREKFDFQKLNTHYYNFEDLQQAMDKAVDGREVMKVMLQFD